MARGLSCAVLALAAVGATLVNSDNVKFLEAKRKHKAIVLSDESTQKIANLSNRENFKAILDQILIPRVVGTPDHEKVGDFIVSQMKDLGWSVEEDIFTDETPVFGPLRFRNIIATLNPNADRYLVLACHYDSKYTREHVFVGATDSAVPCAMLVDLARSMRAPLRPLAAADLSLMLIFFDGEEAFRQWGPADSLYGARHLARKWHATPYKDGTNMLHRMDVLVLLDLLGAPDPSFSSYFPATERWYVRLAAAEQRLAGLGALARYSRGKPDQVYFQLRSSGAYVEDDHIPFLRRSVDVLHVIPSPFPAVWHTAADDAAALDYNTIDNLAKILRVFVAEYLRLA